MFFSCSSLKKLNLDNFNTINISNMSYMFNKCPLLNEIIVSRINTSNLLDKSFTFYGCLDELISKIKFNEGN